MFGILSYFFTNKTPPFSSIYCFLFFPLVAIVLVIIIHDRALSPESYELLIPFIVGVFFILWGNKKSTRYLFNEDVRIQYRDHQNKLKP